LHLFEVADERFRHICLCGSVYAKKGVGAKVAVERAANAEERAMAAACAKPPATRRRSVGPSLDQCYACPDVAAAETRVRDAEIMLNESANRRDAMRLERDHSTAEWNKVASAMRALLDAVDDLNVKPGLVSRRTAEKLGIATRRAREALGEEVETKP
jgi:hypothetical protein